MNTPALATIAAPNARPAQMPRLGELPQHVEISVTREDIGEGIRNSGNWCPIARAIRREFGRLGVHLVSLDVQDLRIEVCTDAAGPWTRYWHNASAFVIAFDRGQRVMPRAVTLELLSS